MIRKECSECLNYKSPDWCLRIASGMPCTYATPGEMLPVSEALFKASTAPGSKRWDVLTPPSEIREASSAGLTDAVLRAPASNSPLPTDAQARKAVPIFSGVLKYFPDAIAAVAECSQKGNDQHHPGKPLHWDRSKSTDELDALSRHLVEAGTPDTDGVRHSAKVAWRALANLQKEIEAERTALDKAGLGDAHEALTFGPTTHTNSFGPNGKPGPGDLRGAR